jgi:hypothetical protein
MTKLIFKVFPFLRGHMSTRAFNILSILGFLALLMLAVSGISLIFFKESVQIFLIFAIAFTTIIPILIIFFWIYDPIDKIRLNKIKLNNRLNLMKAKKEKEEFISAVKVTKENWNTYFQKVYPNKNLTDEEKKDCLTTKTENEIKRIYLSMHIELKSLSPGSKKHYGYEAQVFEENKFDEINRKFYSGDDNLTSDKPYDVLETANRIILIEKELTKIINLSFPQENETGSFDGGQV